MTSSFQGNPNLFADLDYIFPDDEDQFRLVLRQYLTNLASSLNYREIGTYVSELTVTGQQYLPLFGISDSSSVTYRPTFRKVIDTGALPNTGTSSVPHGISLTSDDSATRIYGGATDPSNSLIPLPFSSPTLADNIQLDIDATNVNITTGNDKTAYTRSFVVIEIMRQV